MESFDSGHICQQYKDIDMDRQDLLDLSPEKIAAVYLIFGVLWVGTTDSIVVALFDSPETITFLQTVKGWIFVVLSSVLVFGLAYVHQHQHEQSEERIQTVSEQLQVLHRFIRHNIRNDLNVVMTRAEIAMEHTKDQQRDSLETVKQKASDLVAMSEKLRVASSLELDEDRQTADLTALTRDAVKTVRRAHPHVEITTDLEETSPVYGDYTIYRAVVELLENAIEHHQGSAAACEISVAISRRSGRFELEVVDNGPPIPSDEIESLRSGVESDLTHMSGVGLWMVKWVCECHGGELKVDTDGPQETTAVLVFEQAEHSRVVEQFTETIDEVRAASA